MKFEAQLNFLRLFWSYLTHLSLLKQENRTFTKRRKWQKTRIVDLTLPERVYWFCDKAQNYFCYNRSLQKLSIGSAVMANRKVKALNQDSNPCLDAILTVVQEITTWGD